MDHALIGQFDGDVGLCASSAFMMVDAMIRALMNQLE
jgi:hypothetical protein